ncbi:hypothetical protein AXG93_3545s1180 [Marchantia polymorpha subsp. ruderalis]|uniref:Uncharacterized protein n=1 Tax=Marchantia polymorpha subsp. ruderalis TaxID=1480154 RepID=A0A176VX29_MARPO|nr:hypothetical protein AXG93_3545s1180 [Marchantia polymorpha subsp. ruderalis]
MRDQSHAAELALKAKELYDCKATRFSELEHREKLDADCIELQSQLLAVEKQLLSRKLNLFTYGLEETKENLEFELSDVLSRIGADKSSTGVATAASAGVASIGALQLAGDVSGCSL